jgi:cytolysin (calcineurin-like family phosphatase)
MQRARVGRWLLVVALVAGSAKAAWAQGSSARANVAAAPLCFTAYRDANYRGASDIYCQSAGNVVANDQYSSLRIPRGMRVRVFEHAGSMGRARTYYGDVPWVGPGFNDLISSFEASTFQSDDFFMAFASDPQFSWGYCSDDPSSSLCQRERSFFAGASDDQIGRIYNVNLVNAINATQDALGAYRFGGVIINGDLTEFGDQDVDLGNYIDIYEHSLDMNVYPGLGNHDYQNNVDDCWQNTCASSMIWYLRDQVATLNPVAFDYAESGVHYSFPSLRKDHSGSLAYSFDIGSVHFAQLNNHPLYARGWNGWNFGAGRRDYFSVGASLDWLRGDLGRARAAQQRVVLNFHDWGSDRDNADFDRVLGDFPVSAVFAGHYHASYGLYDDTKGPYADGKRVPAFLSGSAHYGTFLVSRFVGGKMYVWVLVVDHFDGAKLYVKRDGVLHDASHPSQLFDVCAGCNRYYEDVYDLR